MTSAQKGITDQIGYGLKDGGLVFIADVPRGLACACTCAKCGRPLVAKKGQVRQHHFAHYEASNCRGAAESVLHLLAKELIRNLNDIQLPPYEFLVNRHAGFGESIRHRAIVAKGGVFHFQEVRVEEIEGNFIPDLVLESGLKSLIVEIAVTHKVPRDKLRKIRRRNKPAIEIQLDVSDSLLPRNVLQAKLRLELASKTWLFHPDQRVEERAFFARLRQARASFRRRLNPRPDDERAGTQANPPRQTDRHAALQFIPGGRHFQDECDRLMDGFQRTHGRLPTMDECLQLWPRLWKR